MADDPEIPPPGDESSSDDETIKGDQENERIADMLEEERLTMATPVPIGNGAVASRFRDMVESQADAPSEDGSVYGLPRRAGSPADSLLAVPDDAPSILGRLLAETCRRGPLLIVVVVCLGLRDLVAFPEQQRPALCGLAPRPQRPSALLQAV